MTGDSTPHGEALGEIQQQLQRGDVATALERVNALLDATPDDPDALYLLAVASRFARRPDAALDALARLKRRIPGHGRAHQEEGHLLRGLGRIEDALGAFARAIEHNPALLASHRARVELLSASGRTQEARQALAQLEQVQRLPKALLAATDLLSQGKLLKAEDVCRRFLQQHPRDVEGMRLLAAIGVKLGVLEDAEFLLESAVTFAPDNVAAHVDYVGVLRKRQRFQKALEEAGSLLEREPDNPRFKAIYAVECMQTGDYATALRLFDEVLATLPGDPATLTSRGHALKTSGRYDDAVASYRNALKTLPRHGEAWYALSNLKTYRFTAAELDRMHAVEADGNLGMMERVYLCFALAKAHEDRGEYERAFGYYARGNDMKRAQSRYDADRMHEEFKALMATCTRSFFAEREGLGHDAPDPIFIVGLPRAGSTLLEQILSSHSQVDGTLELPNIPALSQRLRRLRRGNAEAAGARPEAKSHAVAGAGASGEPRHGAVRTSPGEVGYPAVLGTLTAAELKGFGEEFLSATRIHRQGAPFFTDKMPNNFRHVGLIHLMLPRAKIIDARRGPMACCFSGYKQLFAEGQEFSYSLEDIGRYYRDYVSLMDHWDAVLPGRVLRVMHEDVVADLEGQVRRLLEFCELPFEDQCLRYWETERNVRTPSSEQVRRPIVREATEQWRHFAPWLGPLEAALGHGVDAV